MPNCLLVDSNGCSHLNVEACVANAAVTRGAGVHIPEWPDMHMMVFLEYTFQDTVHAKLLYLGSLCRSILEWQLKLCYLITPL